MKFIKLNCRKCDCDTTFLVQANHINDINEYYNCPKCESMVWSNEDDVGFIEVDMNKVYYREE